MASAASDDDLDWLPSDGEGDGDSLVYADRDTEEGRWPVAGNCTVLSEADLRRRQKNDIHSICAVLSVKRAAACLLLVHHGWSVAKLQEAWFTDEDGVRDAVGLPREQTKKRKADSVSCTGGGEATCGICFDAHPLGAGMRDAGGCGHLYCAGCWEGYIGAAVGDGPGCLTLRCPDPDCRAAVDQDMVKRFGADGDKKKYAEYLRRSYVESSRRLKWCPAPGCELALEFVPDGAGVGVYDVFCRCMSGFCWNCGEEAHRPVDCGTVAEWKAKNSSEGPSADYVLAYCKPCPKCRRPIEKNAGCMHMRCRPPCNFDFCWLCLQEFSNYSHRCNVYREEANKPREDPQEKKREMAKRYLERYMHYFLRWEANEMSRKKALAELRALRDGRLALLGDKYSLTEGQLRCLTEAWQLVAECRRVLRWSYAYGYYLPEEEQAKKDFFEHQQWVAERALERLHHCAEVEGRAFFFHGKEEEEGGSGGGGDSEEEFLRYRNKLSGLTRVTREHFEKLVWALEGGQAEVTVAVQGGGKGEEGGGSGGQGDEGWSGGGGGGWLVQDGENWYCGHCTYKNPLGEEDCAMCGLPAELPTTNTP